MTDHAAALEELRRRLLAGGPALSAALHAGAEHAQAIVHALDSESAAAPEREASALAALERRPVSLTADALIALEAEERLRGSLRKVGAWLAAQLADRVRAAKKKEAAIAEGRKPLADLTRHVHETAKRLATYPALAERAVQLVATDHWLAKIARGAYRSIPPRPESRSLGVEYDEVPLIAGDIRHTLVLPRVRAGERDGNFWPRRYGDISFVESLSWRELSDQDILGEVIRLNGSGPNRQEVDRTVDKAQVRLWTEFQKVFAAISELQALDASIDDINQRYPDGGLIWDRDLFQAWSLKGMSGHYGIVLPNLRGRQAAA